MSKLVSILVTLSLGVILVMSGRYFKNSQNEHMDSQIKIDSDYVDANVTSSDFEDQIQDDNNLENKNILDDFAKDSNKENEQNEQEIKNDNQTCSNLEKSETKDNNSNAEDNMIENTDNESTIKEGNLEYLDNVEQTIFEMVNQERTTNGVQALEYDNTMQRYARIKSKDMGDNNYFTHEDLSGKYITSIMQSEGIKYNEWAENIAYIEGVNDEEQLAKNFMTNWMNSSGHRKNILSTNYLKIGIGVYKIGTRIYATQEFIK